MFLNLPRWCGAPGLTYCQTENGSTAFIEGTSTTTSVTDGQIVNYETLRLVVMSDNVIYMAE